LKVLINYRPSAIVHQTNHENYCVLLIISCKNFVQILVSVFIYIN